VHVRVRPDKRFTRDGDDIRTQVSLPVTDALLGTQISVETVHGKVTLKIPEGTQPGQVFRLKGKGLPVLGTSRHGDHYVTVNIEIPKKLSKAEKKLVEEWREKRD
jgi:molecular chaperone DnaJ